MVRAPEHALIHTHVCTSRHSHVHSHLLLYLLLYWKPWVYINTYFNFTLCLLVLFLFLLFHVCNSLHWHWETSLPLFDMHLVIWPIPLYVTHSYHSPALIHNTHIHQIRPCARPPLPCAQSLPNFLKLRHSDWVPIHMGTPLTPLGL